MNAFILKINFPYNFKIQYSSLGITKCSFVSKNKNALESKDVPKEMRATCSLIQKYFKGEKVDLSKINIDIDSLTSFQKSVYQTLKKIPFGKVISYKELADKIKNPGAIRAVGSAMKKNPIAIIIPCHRVIKSGGFIGNYNAPGGSQTKTLLLEKENINNA